VKSFGAEGKPFVMGLDPTIRPNPVSLLTVSTLHPVLNLRGSKGERAPEALTCAPEPLTRAPEALTCAPPAPPRAV
jgi:hypothetical protein